MREAAQPTREEQERSFEEDKRKASLNVKTLGMSGETNALDVTVTAGKKELVVRDYEGEDIPVYQFNEKGAYARTYSYTDRRGRHECMTEYFIGTPRDLAPESTVFQNHETFPAYLHSIMLLCLNEIDAGRLRQRKIGDDIRSCVTISLDRYLALQGLEGCASHTRKEARKKLLSYALEMAQVGCHKVEYARQADGKWKAFRWTFAVAVSSATWDSKTEELTCVMESTFLEIFRKPGADDAKFVTSRPVPAALVKVDRDSLEHAVYRYLIQQYTNNGMVRRGRHTHIRFSSLQEWLMENSYTERPHRGDSNSFRARYQTIVKALDRLERDTDTFSYTFLLEDTLEELDLAYTALPDKESGYKGGLIYSPGRKSKEVARTLDRCVIEIAMDELDPYAESVRAGRKKKRRRAKAAPAKKA